LAWLKNEFRLTSSTANNYVKVAKAFANTLPSDRTLQIDSGALFLLSAPDVPEEVRVAAVEEARAGGHITRVPAERLLAEAAEAQWSVKAAWR
jgi:hypothetical protein